jgi:hypothetical protein
MISIIMFVTNILLSLYQSKSDYDIFFNKFSEVKTPFSIDSSFIEKNRLDEEITFAKVNYKSSKYIINNIIGLRDSIDELFNPYGDNFYSIGKLYYKDYYITIMYFQGGAGGCDEEYYLSIFNNFGNLISSKVVAYKLCEGNIIYSCECIIKKNFKIILTKKEYRSANYNNYKFFKSKKEFYIINNNGVITKQKKDNRINN